jgi:hypothetical protein
VSLIFQNLNLGNQNAPKHNGISVITYIKERKIKWRGDKAISMPMIDLCFNALERFGNEWSNLSGTVSPIPILCLMSYCVTVSSNPLPYEFGRAQLLFWYSSSGLRGVMHCSVALSGYRSNQIAFSSTDKLPFRTRACLY